MEYATPHYIGHGTDAHKEKANSVVQTAKGIYGIDAKNKGRTGNRQGQAEASSSTDVTNGFLRTTFLPKLEASKTMRPATETEKIETDFYRSLHAVAGHYKGFEPTETKTFGYPYNIALSVWEIENHLKKNVKNLSSLCLVEDGSGKAFFISEERYDTGTTLFYIHVLPLYRMLADHRKRKAGLLLLSVFAYLYHVADIPYYRQEDTYIYWHYEMIEDWIEQDEETELESSREELKLAKWCGDRIERKIFNRKNLEVFAGRIKSFSPRDDFERDCLNVAKETFSLYSDYPSTTVFRYAQYRYDETVESDELIAMHKYISFVADTNGWLYRTLADIVNDEFGSCT